MALCYLFRSRSYHTTGMSHFLFKSFESKHFELKTFEPKQLCADRYSTIETLSFTFLYPFPYKTLSNFFIEKLSQRSYRETIVTNYQLVKKTLLA